MPGPVLLFCTMNWYEEEEESLGTEIIMNLNTYRYSVRGKESSTTSKACVHFLFLSSHAVL